MWRQVVIVNFHEEIVYATYVRPPEKITDFRTAVRTPTPIERARTLAREILMACRQRAVARLLGSDDLGHWEDVPI